MVSAIFSLLAHGLPLTPETATAKGWLVLGLATLLAFIALIALLRKRQDLATRFLVAFGFCCLVGLCLFATAEALGRGFGSLGVLGIWIAFAVFCILAELVLTSMFRKGNLRNELRASHDRMAEKGRWIDGVPERIGTGGQVLLEDGLAVLVKDVDEHASCRADFPAVITLPPSSRLLA